MTTADEFREHFRRYLARVVNGEFRADANERRAYLVRDGEHEAIVSAAELRTDGDNHDDPNTCTRFCHAGGCDCVRVDAQKETPMPSREKMIARIRNLKRRELDDVDLEERSDDYIRGLHDSHFEDDDERTDANDDIEGNARRAMEQRNRDAWKPAGVTEISATRTDARDVRSGEGIEEAARRRQNERNRNLWRREFGGPKADPPPLSSVRTDADEDCEARWRRGHFVSPADRARYMRSRGYRTTGGDGGPAAA